MDSKYGEQAYSQSSWLETDVERKRKTLERTMNAIKVLLGRLLMSLGIMTVWAKLLAEGRADSQPETDKKTPGGPQQNPNREPK